MNDNPKKTLVQVNVQFNVLKLDKMIVKTLFNNNKKEREDD